MLIQSKSEGGLGLVDLLAKDKALKLTWIQILHKEVALRKIVQYNTVPAMGEHIWACNLLPGHVKYFIQDVFWREVFEAWFEFKSKEDFVSKRCDDIIWLNSDIKVRGLPILWEDIISKGLIYIRQLFQNRRWISPEQAMQQFGLDIMRYNALKVAVPRKIKTELKTTLKVANAVSFVSIMKSKANLSQIAYQAFIVKPSFEPKILRWEIELNVEMDEQQYMRCFKDIYITSNLTKLRSFQFRLLHRAIITNVHMFKWKRREDDLCTFCKKSKETYSHLFVMCAVVQNLWLEVEHFMNKFNKEKINFNIDTVITNRLVDNPRNIKNFICLMLKQFIYRHRCYQTIPMIQEFYHSVYKIKSIEKFVAVKNGKEHKHIKKWENKQKHRTATSTYFDLDDVVV